MEVAPTDRAITRAFIAGIGGGGGAYSYIHVLLYQFLSKLVVFKSLEVVLKRD